MAKKLTKEQRKIISIKTKEAMKRPEVRKKIEKTQYKKGHIPWITGRVHSQKVRRKISKNTKVAMQRKEIREKVMKTTFKKGIIPWNKGRTNVYKKEVIEKIRSARLKQIFPKKDTYIEVLMQNELRRREISFEMHNVLFKRFQPDFVFHENKLAVFCDGDFWHVNPEWIKRENKDRLTEPQIFNIKRDETHNLILEENNWKYLRFWESDIKRNVKKCVDQVESYLKRTTKSSSTSKTSTKTATKS